MNDRVTNVIVAGLGGQGVLKRLENTRSRQLNRSTHCPQPSQICS